MNWIGIVNGIFFLTALCYFIHVSKGYNVHRDPLSLLATYPSISLAYKIVFIVFSLGQFAFVFLLAKHYGGQAAFWLLPLFFTSLLGVLVGLFPMDRSPKIHFFLGALAFPITVLGGVLFGIYLLPQQAIIGWLGIMVSIVMLWSLTRFRVQQTVHATEGLVFFCGLVAWNVLNSISLIN